jgi:glutamine---fructose-6-phosphate transaminase (isomerizing)
MLERGSAVIAVAPGGVSGTAIQPVLDRLIELGTNLAVVGPASAAAASAAAESVARLPLPAGLPEELSPLAEIIPLQMLARELAVVRGLDPDAPRGLRKVTETW